MPPRPPSLETRDASTTTTLGNLLATDVNTDRFRNAIYLLHRRFEIYASTCPVPFISPGLIVTPEIRAQSELYLPIAEIAAVFSRLFSAALTYPPILSSTPFHNALSWADTFVELPPFLQFSVNPSLLLKRLLTDRDLLTEFLFASFLPRRFYGGLGRYPEQQKFLREWLVTRRTVALNCLDAACGTGEETYGLALLLSEEGFTPEEIRITGWTLEPLEVWAATHRRIPHDTRRETLLREASLVLAQHGYDHCISFSCQDILSSSQQTTCHPKTRARAADENSLFDLILCNGLLGGPIINRSEQLDRAAAYLAALLSPGGILLAADRFHGGWKQKCPQTELRALFERHGLQYIDTGEGVGGLKPY
jgi:chemotaxis methyl-accepting protein methylase